MELSRETILNVYRNMVMSRRYEETVNTMYREKKVEEKPLSGVGQEAVSVCMTQLLREDDYAAPTLRSKGVFFAKGVRLSF